MRKRLVPWAALAALAFLAPAAHPDQASTKPSVVIRAASLDTLIADVRFLLEAAGKEEDAKQFDGVVKQFRDDKGLAGFDPTRPLGAYGNIEGQLGAASTVVAMVPVSDEKAILARIESFTNNPPKKDGDLYEVDIEKIHLPLYFRFANKYLYATVRDKDAINKDKLPSPAEILASDKSRAFAASINIDRIPAELKNTVLAQIDLNLANARDKAPPGETPVQARLRVAAVDEVFGRLKSLLRDGGPVEIRLDLDRNAKELAMSVSLAGKPGSSLADAIRSLGNIRSVAASLVGRDSAMSLFIDAGLPAKLHDALGSVIDEAEKKALSQTKDETHRKLATALLEAITPTLKSAELDSGFDIRGPGPGGKYTALFGLRVKDGQTIDKALRKVAADLPAEQRGQVQFDFDKSGSVPIHQVKPEKVDDEAKALLGDYPFYLAVRDDAMLIAAGEKGLEAIKDAIGTAPREGKVFQLELSAARLGPILEKSNKGATKIIEQVFKNETQDDKVRITLTGGDSLKLSLTLKTQLIRFFVLLDQSKKAGP
jgi:hypothetical protein